MGLGLYMMDGEGPCFERPVQDISAIKQLPHIDPEIDLKYVMDAIRLVKKELSGKVPLIGFAGSPWTVATYMVEGHSSKNFTRIKRMLYQQPEHLHQLLKLLAKNTAAYLTAQIAAGADVVMLFDTWGGVLSEDNFKRFSLHYMQLIVDDIKRLTPNVPIILFCKDGGRSVAALSNTGAAAVSLDWTADLRAAACLVNSTSSSAFISAFDAVSSNVRVANYPGKRVALQGNLDPAVLYGSDELIKTEVGKVLDNFRNGINSDGNNNIGHIFNLGHGIAPDVNPEKVHVLVEAVKAQSQR
jgi:uroporphyrinogen decarboxylase